MYSDHTRQIIAGKETVRGADLLPHRIYVMIIYGTDSGTILPCVFRTQGRIDNHTLYTVTVDADGNHYDESTFDVSDVSPTRIRFVELTEEELTLLCL